MAAKGCQDKSPNNQAPYLLANTEIRYRSQFRIKKELYNNLIIIMYYPCAFITS